MWRTTHRGKGRQWRAAIVAVAVAGFVAGASPADAHFQPTVPHLWAHIRGLADARYVLAHPFVAKGAFHLFAENPSAPGTMMVEAISFGTLLATPPVPRVLRLGAAATPECPGSVDNPQAAVGFFCVYEAASLDVATLDVADSGGAALVLDTAGRSGATLIGTSLGNTQAEARGTWALSMP